MSTFRPLAGVLSLVQVAVFASLAACAAEQDPLGEHGPGGKGDFAGDGDSSHLRINHLQAIGTHNSYHLDWPVAPLAYSYEFAPLDVQLEEQGIRKVELDIQHKLGRFMVLHDLRDPGTTCTTLKDCLSTMKTWSDAHPGHHPIMVFIEPKDWRDAAPGEIDAASYAASVEQEILSVWPEDRLVTPAQVRSSAGSLREAVQTKGWPSIDESRGRLIIALWGQEGSEAVTSSKLFWIGEGAMSDDMVMLMRDNPLVEEAQINEELLSGALVRTRADADMVEVSQGDYRRFDAAARSGAQFISTDSPRPQDGYSYFVSLAHDYGGAVPSLVGSELGTPSRCNPVTAPADCTSAAIEHLP